VYERERDNERKKLEDDSRQKDKFKRQRKGMSVRTRGRGRERQVGNGAERDTNPLSLSHTRKLTHSSLVSLFRWWRVCCLLSLSVIRSVSYCRSLTHSVCSPFFVLSLFRSYTLIFFCILAQTPRHTIGLSVLVAQAQTRQQTLPPKYNKHEYAHTVYSCSQPHSHRRHLCSVDDVLSAATFAIGEYVSDESSEHEGKEQK